MSDSAEPDTSMTDVQETGSSAPKSTDESDNKAPWWRRWIVAALVLGGLGAAVYFAGDIPKTGGHYGFWSVLPPLIAIVLAFWMQEVVSALFIGIAAGGIISGQVNIIDAFLLPAIGTEDFALILLVYLWALGGLIGLWTRTGGALRFAKWAGEKMVRGPRTAKIYTSIM